jgi:hypothetical protein
MAEQEQSVVEMLRKRRDARRQVMARIEAQKFSNRHPWLYGLIMLLCIALAVCGVFYAIAVIPAEIWMLFLATLVVGVFSSLLTLASMK